MTRTFRIDPLSLALEAFYDLLEGDEFLLQRQGFDIEFEIRDNKLSFINTGRCETCGGYTGTTCRCSFDNDFSDPADDWF